MNQTKKLLNFRELARRAGYHEKGLDLNRIPIKHQEAFKEILNYLEDFVEKIKKS